MNRGNAPVATPPVDAHTELPPQSAPDRLTLLQHAYLLEQLAAGGATSTSAAELNRKIGKGAERELKLKATVANAVRAALAERGYLQQTKAGRNVHYAITDA